MRFPYRKRSETQMSFCVFVYYITYKSIHLFWMISFWCTNLKNIDTNTTLVTFIYKYISFHAMFT